MGALSPGTLVSETPGAFYSSADTVPRQGRQGRLGPGTAHAENPRKQPQASGWQEVFFRGQDLVRAASCFQRGQSIRRPQQLLASMEA